MEGGADGDEGAQDGLVAYEVCDCGRWRVVTLRPDPDREWLAAGGGA